MSWTCSHTWSRPTPVAHRRWRRTCTPASCTSPPVGGHYVSGVTLSLSFLSLMANKPLGHWGPRDGRRWPSFPTQRFLYFFLAKVVKIKGNSKRGVDWQNHYFIANFLDKTWLFGQSFEAGFVFIKLRNIHQLPSRNLDSTFLHSCYYSIVAKNYCTQSSNAASTSKTNFLTPSFE